MKIFLTNKRGQKVGFYCQEDHTYYTFRDANKGQVFYKRKDLLGFVGLDIEIYDKLLALGCERVCYIVSNWDYDKKIIKPIGSYNIYYTIETIKANKKLVNFEMTKMGGKQYIINLALGTRTSIKQEMLVTK